MSNIIGSILAKLELDISNFSSQLSAAQNAVEQTGKKFEGLNKLGSGITNVGSTLTKSLTVPIMGAGTACVATAANFEEAMSKVQALAGISDKTGDEMKSLTDKALEMEAKTKFSASEAAEAFQYMAMAGWDTDDMLNSIEGVMNLAAASGEDLGTVSDIVTDAMTAFGLSADGTSKVLKDGLEVEVANTTRFVDVLAAAATNSNTDVSKMGESFKYVAPMCGALGYSAEDTAVALGLMANSGIKSSQAGTSLRRLLINMASPTDTVAAAMETLGLSLEDDEGNMYSLMEVMEQLRSSFAGGTMSSEEFAEKMSELDSALESGAMSEAEYEMAVNDLAVAMYGAEGAQKAQLAASLAGATGLSGLLSIVNATEEDFDSLTDSIYNASGTAQEMSDTMIDNLSGQLTILESNLESLAISFGNLLMPAIKKVIEVLQGWVEKINNLSDEQKETIIRIAAVVAAIGPLLMVVGKVITTVSKIPAVFQGVKQAATLLAGGLSKVITIFGGISAPVIAVVAVIGTLIAAFTHLWKTNEEFRNKMTAIWNGIVEKFKAFTDGIVERLNALGFDFENFGEVVKAIWDGFCSLLAPIFEGVFNQIGVILGAALDVLTGLFDFFAGLFTGDWEQCWQGIEEIFGAVWDLIKGTFESWGIAFKGILDTVLGWFGTTWEECWTGIKDFFTNLWDGIVTWFTGVIEGISNFFTNTWESISTFFQNIWNAIYTFFTNIVDNIVSTVTENFGGFFEAIKNIFTGIKDFFVNIWEVIKNIFLGVILVIAELISGNFEAIKTDIQNIWENIKTAFQNIWEAIKQIFTGVLTAIREFTEGVWNTMKTVATTVWDGIKNTISNVLNTIKSVFESIWNAIKSFFTGATDTMKNTASNAFENMKNAISNSVSNIKNAIVNGFNSAIQFITSLPSKALTWGKDIIGNIVDGINSCLEAVRNAASNVANTIKSILGFSVPETGPLHDFMTYMPDMIEGLTQSMEKSSPMLMKAASKIAGELSDIWQDEDLIPALEGADISALSGNSRRFTPIGSDSDDAETISDGGDGKVIIENITVRDDDDIDKITEGMYNKNKDILRALGRRDKK